MELDFAKTKEVLAQASALRSKLTKVDDNTSAAVNNEEVQTLVTICNAFESLESELVILQDLHNEHEYRRQNTINLIDHRRKMLLLKLKNYNGNNQDVIQEAISFASTKLKPDVHGPRKSETSNKETSSTIMNWSSRGFWFLADAVAKSLVTLGVVVSISTLAGFDTKVTVTRKKGDKMKVSDPSEQHNHDGQQTMNGLHFLPVWLSGRVQRWRNEMYHKRES